MTDHTVTGFFQSFYLSRKENTAQFKTLLSGQNTKNMTQKVK